MTRCRSIAYVLCAGLVVCGVRAAGQTQAVMVVAQGAPQSGAPGVPTPPPPIGTPLEELPSFEVASVKKAEGSATSMALRAPGGGRITLVNLPLQTIVLQAFGIRADQVEGAPSWWTSDRFTINAKAENNAPREQLLVMLRSLLVERFQLKFHVETRERQAYVLTTADEEWKPTERMKPVECTPPAGGPAAGAPINISQLRCGSIRMSTDGLEARGMTMATFASFLGSIGGLGLVHDRTGLTGTYDIRLEASVTSLLRSSLVLSSMLNPSSPDNLMPTLGEGRSLGSAVEDLGLKLDRRREPVDVLVIDSISQPDED